MFLLFFTLIPLAFGIYFLSKYKKSIMPLPFNENGKRDYGYVFMVIFAIMFMIMTTTNFVNYSTQIKTFENARKVHKRISILENKNEKLYTMFALHLSKEYPEIEKEIFTKISSANAVAKNINVVFQYPELKSSVTLMKLVDEMKVIAEELYSEQLLAENVYEVIRYNKENPWILMKLSIPYDLVASVYSVKNEVNPEVK